VLLEIENVHSFYGTSHVLHGVSLNIDATGIVSVLGRNGVGKTTLMRTITGIILPERGKVRFNGEDITRLKSHHRARLGISYVPQGRELIPDITVAENLRVALLGKGKGKAKNGALPDYVFEFFPAIRDLLRRKAGTLSGGQQQQVAIARALIQEPILLLLDEPTEGLQPSIVEEIQTIIKRIHADHDCAILLVEQNLDFVREVTQNFAMMEGGQISVDGTIAELTEDLVKQHLSV
jgi:urea transport system ATP-binding protein